MKQVVRHRGGVDRHVQPPTANDEDQIGPFTRPRLAAEATVNYSSHLERIVSVEAVPYTRAPSRDQPVTLNDNPLPYVGIESWSVAGVTLE
jgi:hypothetical protein